jgi:transmembrane sensor
MAPRGRTAEPNTQILDEAAYWFVEFNEGDVDAGSRQEFDRWLRASPEHMRAYLQVSALWEDAPLLAKDRDLDVDELIRHTLDKDNVVPLREGGGLQDEGGGPQGGGISSKGWRARWSWTTSRVVASTAAALVVTIVVVLTVIKPWAHEYVTDIGEQQAITLQDGSIIELNSRSRAQVRYNKSERGVDLLEGQALFRVAKDPSRPFVVRCGVTQVRAVGTQFDVYRKENGTTVTVVEGRVLVSNVGEPKSGRTLTSETPPKTVARGAAKSRSGDTAVLNAGQQITVAPNIPLEPSVADVETTTAWTQRRLVFKNAPLTEVVAEYNRYNPRRLHIGDPTLRDFHISGVFAAADGVSLVEFLRAQPNLVLHTTDSEIEILTQEP